jgi:hypothetical protein
MSFIDYHLHDKIILDFLRSLNIKKFGRNIYSLFDLVTDKDDSDKLNFRLPVIAVFHQEVFNDYNQSESETDLFTYVNGDNATDTNQKSQLSISFIQEKLQKRTFRHSYRSKNYSINIGGKNRPLFSIESEPDSSSDTVMVRTCHIFIKIAEIL